MGDRHERRVSWGESFSQRTRQTQGEAAEHGFLSDRRFSARDRVGGGVKRISRRGRGARGEGRGGEKKGSVPFLRLPPRALRALREIARAGGEEPLAESAAGGGEGGDRRFLSDCRFSARSRVAWRVKRISRGERGARGEDRGEEKRECPLLEVPFSSFSPRALRALREIARAGGEEPLAEDVAGGGEGGERGFLSDCRFSARSRVAWRVKRISRGERGARGEGGRREERECLLPESSSASPASSARDCVGRN